MSGVVRRRRPILNVLISPHAISSAVFVWPSFSVSSMSFTLSNGLVFTFSSNARPIELGRRVVVARSIALPSPLVLR